LHLPAQASLLHDDVPDHVRGGDDAHDHGRDYDRVHSHNRILHARGGDGRDRDHDRNYMPHVHGDDGRDRDHDRNYMPHVRDDDVRDSLFFPPYKNRLRSKHMNTCSYVHINTFYIYCQAFYTNLRISMYSTFLQDFHWEGFGTIIGENFIVILG